MDQRNNVFSSGENREEKPHELLIQISLGNFSSIEILEKIIYKNIMRIVRNHTYDENESIALFYTILKQIISNISLYKGKTNKDAWNWINQITSIVLSNYHDGLG
jgi:hypothetical protein